jgi:hypothetical protein
MPWVRGERMRRSKASLLSFLSCASLVAAPGCSSGDLTLPSDGAPAELRIVDGDGQSGRTGDRLAKPLVVQVLDARSRPVVGVGVAFSFSGSAGGALEPPGPTTDDSGHAAARVRLGGAPGRQLVTARVLDGAAGSAVTFTVTALAPPPPPPPSDPSDDGEDGVDGDDPPRDDPPSDGGDDGDDGGDGGDGGDGDDDDDGDGNDKGKGKGKRKGGG